MRNLLACLVLLAAFGPVRAQTEDERDIRAIITQQLEAFQVDDFATAFTFASPALQGIFQTPERFGQMVEGGYPMVHRPQSYRFDTLREVAGGLWQGLVIYDAAGRGYLVEYLMIETEEGWRINGVEVRLLPEAQV